ncbi:MAG: iron-containing alcohol dehydrogenase [Prevotella sp.]|nr:iron-containing alcohol dehydrogenase [Prevotella sp.]
MKAITLLQPGKIQFGTGCMEQFCKDYLAMGKQRLFVLTAPVIRPMLAQMEGVLHNGGVEIAYFDDITAEPTVTDFKRILEEARAFKADSVIGVGGGSVLDLSKLVATLIYSDQQIEDLFGIGFVNRRGVWFACMPTTSGTGSEVSPNAILLDERDALKKGVVSPHLMADAAYIDPQLTWTVPPKITAETGMDALTHCIEAYTNKFAHPLVDVYALQGIRLIASNLLRAVKNGRDVEAREALSLGSMYGGMCLGPVNTAAVHALSYPLGGEFHISHGLSNAILLPSVMKFNSVACIERYADVAIACGVEQGKDAEETAQRGVEFITRLSMDCGIPTKLSEIGIPQSAVDGMAKAAMNVQRLLKNNPRTVTESDAHDIYNSLY